MRYLARHGFRSQVTLQQEGLSGGFGDQRSGLGLRYRQWPAAYPTSGSPHLDFGHFTTTIHAAGSSPTTISSD
jgi:hypothetical protein